MGLVGGEIPRSTILMVSVHYGTGDRKLFNSIDF